MTDPERTHTDEPVEGADHPGEEDGTGRTPSTEEPAEGGDLGQAGAESPEST